MSLSPLPQQLPFQASPSSSPRKRSVHEIEDPGLSSPSQKRPLLACATENQENQDPGLVVASKDLSKSHEQHSIPPPSVEITVRSEDSVVMSGSKTTIPSGVSSVEAKPVQQPLSFSPAKSDSASTLAATKKRKLSPTSQDAKQQEKEARERQRLEDKAKKEEEKRLRAEEKKKRDEEREEEKRLKEEEKKKREAEREEKKKVKDEEKAAKEAAKEEEKKRKEEDRLKKERAQPKLNSFFAKPSLPSTTVKDTPSPKKPAPASSDLHPTRSPQSTKSDYEKAFPEFFLQSHTKLAPCHRFDRDPEALKHVRQKLDASLDASHTTPYEHLPFRPSEIFHIIPFHRRCGRPRQSVREILLRIQNVTDDSLMDLDGKDQTKAAEEARDILRRIPMKTLRFGEDVRPPYQGTFSRFVPAASAKKLARNPYHRGLPDINYEYDSEAEWEEPGEGEDLDSEEDEEGSDDGDDDMDGFLDDEDDALLAGKRRLIVGDLEPVSSGLRWATDGVNPEMKAYQVETISDTVKFPIDPFSTTYWEKPKPAVEPAPTQPRIAPAGNGTLGVFRVSTAPGAPAVGSARLPATTKAKRPFPPDQLDEFKQAVEASDLNKIGTIEILKKRFPKVTKETIKATLDQYAVRVGQKETDKKWVWR